MKLQFINAAVSADIRSATACFPKAPDGGDGALFYLNQWNFVRTEQIAITIYQTQECANLYDRP